MRRVGPWRWAVPVLIAVVMMAFPTTLALDTAPDAVEAGLRDGLCAHGPCPPGWAVMAANAGGGGHIRLPTGTYAPSLGMQPSHNPCNGHGKVETGEIYVSPPTGVPRRAYPELHSPYWGVAGQNTRLVLECKQGAWYRVSDAWGSFWVREGWVSRKPVATPRPALQGSAPPPIYRTSGVVTLSFDDSAPLARAHAILDVLGQKGVKAVFCVRGNWARAHPGFIERVRAEGHALCNHTASHPDLTALSDEGIRAEIAGGALPDDGGRLRPPYGAYDARVQAIAASMGYVLYLWSIDPRDWTGASADTIVNTVLSNLHPGAIILLHLHGANTLAALPHIIDGILAAGYEIGY